MGRVRPPPRRTKNGAPLMRCQSYGFAEAARTRITISFSFGVGFSTSRSCRTSGGPYRPHTIAFTRLARRSTSSRSRGSVSTGLDDPAFPLLETVGEVPGRDLYDDDPPSTDTSSERQADAPQPETFPKKLAEKLLPAERAACLQNDPHPIPAERPRHGGRRGAGRSVTARGSVRHITRREPVLPDLNPTLDSGSVESRTAATPRPSSQGRSAPRTIHRLAWSGRAARNEAPGSVLGPQVPSNRAFVALRRASRPVLTAVASTPDSLVKSN